jgi:hypothetical protein
MVSLDVAIAAQFTVADDLEGVGAKKFDQA